ncbi:hypothetical protein ON010_g16888 [Phytophthora cinnamomi]|nr:hypothetical protein ON010_g16888 [Phytophthora cinnamomi]
MLWLSKSVLGGRHPLLRTFSCAAMDPTALVRESTARVVQRAVHVRIDPAAVERLAVKLGNKLGGDEQGVVTWDSGDFHYFQDVARDGPLTCQYVMEYEHLARGLKMALLRDPRALDAANLAKVTNEIVASWFHPFTPPQLDERRRKVREVGEVLERFFDGLAINLIKQADFSAVDAIRLVLAYFPGGVLILVGDVWAAYGRRTSGVASFHDIGKLTMFADYRVPQVLRPEGVMVYSEELSKMVDSKTEIPAGSEVRKLSALYSMELEIRAATIQAVEMIHQHMASRGYQLEVIELDWLLWQIDALEETMHAKCPSVAAALSRASNDEMSADVDEMEVQTPAGTYFHARERRTERLSVMGIGRACGIARDVHQNFVLHGITPCGATFYCTCTPRRGTSQFHMSMGKGCHATSVPSPGL